MGEPAVRRGFPTPTCQVNGTEGIAFQRDALGIEVNGKGKFGRARTFTKGCMLAMKHGRTFTGNCVAAGYYKTKFDSFLG